MGEIKVLVFFSLFHFLICSGKILTSDCNVKSIGLEPWDLILLLLLYYYYCFGP